MIHERLTPREQNRLATAIAGQPSDEQTERIRDEMLRIIDDYCGSILGQSPGSTPALIHARQTHVVIQQVYAAIETHFPDLPASRGDEIKIILLDAIHAKYPLWGYRESNN